MTKSKNAKRALFASILSMLLCCAMLVGSTFAWFTDSVTSGKNKIVAGNLDVNLQYTTDGSNWQNVGTETNLFMPDALWEPGHMEVAYLKVENLGSLALKYQLGMNAEDTVISTSVTEKELKLSEHLKYAVVELTANEGSITPYTREGAKEALKTATVKALNETYNENGVMYPAKANDATYPAEKYLALIVYMPEEVGNDANHKTGEAAPEITLGINLIATQTPYENDSFGKDYDDQAASEENMKLIAREAQGWTLAASASDMSGDGKYILTEDIADAVALTAADHAVIDLNGKTITGRLTVSGNVTLIDSSADGKGQITNSSGISVGKNSLLTVEAGTYTRIAPTDSTTTIVMNGGTITGQSYGNKAKWIINDGHFSSSNILFSMTQGETVTINGGTFEGIVNFGSRSSPATVIINGGTFNGDVSATYGTWNINNGIFNGPVYASVSTGYVYATCTITGGTFNHTGNKCSHVNSHYMFYGNASTPDNYYRGYTITGGSFKTDPTNYMNDSSGVVQMDSTTGYYAVATN